ncbi:hypothetical protein NDU88_004429 [Pleurodeles waltl]|uniref:Uncharacterized protein n=1 Tax=Pleurodeles waltl TaxID=8319 RepID=A0AAV7LI92_PLEWA|nr:hypothetical protein NDU88_004429 [Pleurodeles waltl]
MRSCTAARELEKTACARSVVRAKIKYNKNTSLPRPGETLMLEKKIYTQKLNTQLRYASLRSPAANECCFHYNSKCPCGTELAVRTALCPTSEVQESKKIMLTQQETTNSVVKTDLTNQRCWARLSEHPGVLWLTADQLSSSSPLKGLFHNEMCFVSRFYSNKEFHKSTSA